MEQTIHQATLSNGLTVVLREMHHAPVASFWVWYKVGSRNEPTGRTGISHWVEHMMFKGTEKYPAGAMDRLINREGGRWNAFTWLDFTAYYETMPVDRIDLAIEMEADRMANAVMSDEDVESERTVILSELHMYENQPMFLLNQELTAAAFRVHGYHHDTIGDEWDLQSMTPDDLRGHYQQFYTPANAVVVVAGDFETEAMLALLEAHFGAIPAGPPPTAFARPEPTQRGERRVTVTGPGDAAYLIYSYKAPQATDLDFYALSLLNAAFTGGSSLGMFGRGTTNKSSRLYGALVETGLAAAAFGSLAPTIDPYLFSIGAVVTAGQAIEDVEAALAAEIARLASEPITATELEHALKRAKVQLIMASQSASGQGQMMGYSAIVTGDPLWSEKAIERLNEVTLADLARVREHYLRPERVTIGRYVPA